MLVACTRKTKGRSPHIQPASSRRHTRSSSEAISRSYLSPLISTEMVLRASFYILLLTCFAADTHADWPDEDEENAFKKDVADDQLIIHDYSRFHSPDGKWMKLDINPAFKFIFQGLSVRSKDPAFPDGGLAYRRWKRESEDIVEYSGDYPEGDPCDVNPCPEPGQTCVSNTSSLDDFHCECKPGFENVTGASNLTCIAVSADKLQKENLAQVIGLGVGIPVCVIVVLVIVFLLYRRRNRSHAFERNSLSEENQSNISATFSRLPMFRALRQQGMYQPHAFSETPEMVKKYQHYSNDHDYSERALGTSREAESTRLNTEEPASFSWDRFSKTVPEEEFHIKRPKISISSNPAFQI